MLGRLVSSAWRFFASLCVSVMAVWWHGTYFDAKILKGLVDYSRSPNQTNIHVNARGMS